MHEALELGEQALVGLLVVGGVVDLGGPVFGHDHAVAGVGQVFAGEPEVNAVAGEFIEGEVGGELGRAGLEHVGIGLADHGDVAEGEIPVVGAEIEVVEGEGLLVAGEVGGARWRGWWSCCGPCSAGRHIFEPLARPWGCLSLADFRRRAAELMAPPATTTISAEKVCFWVTAPVMVLPVGSVSRS